MRVLSRASARWVVVAAVCAAALPACSAASSATGAAAPATTAASAAAPPSASSGTAGPVPASATVSATASATASASPTATAAPCGAGFSTSPRATRSTRTAQLVAVRTGRQGCSDRLVLEFRGRVDGYTVRYVPQVSEDGSGRPVPLAGGAKLQVTVVAPAYDDQGRATYQPADPGEVADVEGYRAFRQVAWAGSFEGYSTLGIGVARTLPFRVVLLTGPGTHTRLVVDVAHQG